MTRKIVVLNDFPIFPVSHGGKVRIYNIYREIARYFDVTYLSYSAPNVPEKRQVTDHFTTVGVPKSRLHRLIDRLIPYVLRCSGDDLIAMLVSKYDHRLCEAARKCIDDADIIVCSHPYLYPVVKKYAGNKPVIYDSQNVEYSLKRSLLKGPFFKKIALFRLHGIEGELVNRSRLVFATSDLDREELKQMYGVSEDKFYVSPNGTDITYYDALFNDGQLIKSQLIGQPLAIFLGSGHPPNVEAVKTLIRTIAPVTGGVYFLICGSVGYMVDRVRVGKNVGLAYMVSDDEKLELFRGADIALNPMLSGSGTNVKMLDYLAAGLPVITTPVGARGLGLENGRHAIICDIDEFPSKIREVLGDRELYGRLSREGRKLVEEQYDWRKIARSMAETIENTLEPTS